MWRWCVLVCAACGTPARQSPDARPLDTCPTITITPVPSVPSIELVLDRSGSMAQDFGGVDRYAAMREALVGANGVVTTHATSVGFGAALYAGAPACPTIATVPRALGNRDGIAALIDSAVPEGSTPTVAAINAAIADFAAAPPALGMTAVILLAGDGEPNTCDGAGNAKPASLAAATEARHAGIRTLVLDLGGTAESTHQQAMANAGAGVLPGTPDAPVYSASDPAQLGVALDSIVSGVLECELSLGVAVDPNSVSGATVTLNGAVLTYGSQWILLGTSTLELLGSACAAVRAAPTPIVTATFPCGALIP